MEKKELRQWIVDILNSVTMEKSYQIVDDRIVEFCWTGSANWNKSDEFTIEDGITALRSIQKSFYEKYKMIQELIEVVCKGRRL